MPKELFAHEKNGAVDVLRLLLPDQLDAMEFDQLNSSLTTTLQTNAAGKWIVNLSAVSYMGSAVLGLMVNIRQQIKSGRGSLILCEMSPKLHYIFKTCCLEKLFTIAKTHDEALSLLRR
jgi:stage II sporulation protein AA (anti-sigma F factor antagonist)